MDDLINFDETKYINVNKKIAPPKSPLLKRFPHVPLVPDVVEQTNKANPASHNPLLPGVESIQREVSRPKSPMPSTLLIPAYQEPFVDVSEIDNNPFDVLEYRANICDPFDPFEIDRTDYSGSLKLQDGSA